jgi:peptidoglycan/LPS O-acetylase OafA/YrhL
MSGQTMVHSGTVTGTVGGAGIVTGTDPGVGRARHRAPDPVRRPGSLQERFDPRNNHLSVIRLGLATLVAVVHGLQVGFGHQPYLGRTGYGELAVDAFFVLSGFLLAGSYLRLNSIRRYAWHRFLRIMPGFWVCLLVTALAAAPMIAYLEGRTITSVFRGDESAIRFLTSNCLLLMQQFGIVGLPTYGGEPGILNGSLWTLFYEALCYAAVVGLGVIGALRRRPEITLFVIGLLWAAIAINSAGVDVVGQERMLRFGLMFLIGTGLCLYADRVPVRGDLALVALAGVLLSLLFLPDYRALAAPAFGYLCLWLVVLRVPTTTWLRSDFSYGLYVYHWPILQILVAAGVTHLGRPVFVIVGVALAMAAALFSWDLVERPALQYKDAAWVTSDRRRASAPRQR